MIDFIAHNLAPIMFCTVMAMLLLGYPVAFTLAAGGLAFFVIGVELSHLSTEINLTWTLLQSHPARVFGIMSNETLLAIPFFTFMGLVLERSGMAEDLLDTIGQLFGPVRGGLALAVVLVGALLAATTGIVAASVMAMGLISLPIMLRYGYSPSVASGTVAASGTLAQIVPPSLVLIVMADQLGRPVGDMYVGAFVPAMISIGLYCAFVMWLAVFRPNLVPALPLEARKFHGGLMSLVVILALSIGVTLAAHRWGFAGFTDEARLVVSVTLGALFALGATLINRKLSLGLLSHLAEQVVIVLIPPLALIFLVLGTIFLGIATPTEGGAMGATGALILAFLRRRLNYDTLKSALNATARLAAFVMFILIGARIFGLTFYGINGNLWIEELLLQLPGGELGFLIFVTLIVFILGCFLDFFEIAFIVVPLLVPVADQLGIDLIWFGVILGINLQTSFLTPPFGFSLFFLRSVAPDEDWTDPVTSRRMKAVRTIEIYKGALPFIGLQVFLLALVISFPGLVTHYKDVTPPTAGSIQQGLPGLGALPSLGGGSLPGLPGSDSGGGMLPLKLSPLGGQD
ncbi:TRAP transporter large permease subunit [Rhodobacteraceae bacterium KMM 6894]|nr:TRAP transporter large permease subunit [Rhodobacteraceae bacterium KMM 6894]